MSANIVTEVDVMDENLPQISVDELNELLSKTFKKPIDKIISEDLIASDSKLKYYGVSLTHRIQVKAKRYPPFYSPAGSECQSPRSCSRNCHLSNGFKLETRSFIEFTPEIYEKLKYPRYASWFSVISQTPATADSWPIRTLHQSYVGFGDSLIFAMGEVLPTSCYTSKDPTICNYDMRRLKEITEINNRNSTRNLCLQLVFEDELPEMAELEVTEMNAVLYDSSKNEATYVFVDPSWYL